MLSINFQAGKNRPRGGFDPRARERHPVCHEHFTSPALGV